MKDQINFRIDSTIKTEVEDILKQLGLTKTQAIKLFFNKIIQTKSIPFSINIPNEETIKALNAAEDGKNLKKFKNKQKLFSDLGI
ncbi:MAG: type II toxin-antitoxin system RelB/DinJ family antitoxin [Candidatus Muiribacteriota bacterium]|jgi:DNA-damage-inducible protein J